MPLVLFEARSASRPLITKFLLAHLERPGLNLQRHHLTDLSVELRSESISSRDQRLQRDRITRALGAPEFLGELADATSGTADAVE